MFLFLKRMKNSVHFDDFSILFIGFVQFKICNYDFIQDFCQNERLTNMQKFIRNCFTKKLFGLSAGL